MNRPEFLLTVGLLVCAAVGCSSGGSQQSSQTLPQNYGSNSNSEPAKNAGPLTYKDAYASCEPADNYDAGEISCYVDN